jgi:lysozyme family protein
MGNYEEIRMGLTFNFLKKAKVPDSVIDQNSEPTTFDYCIDMCINMGSRNAGRVLQRAANAKNPASAKIKVDGMIGPNTIKAVKKVEQGRLRSERVLYYARIVIKKPVQYKYWYGWFKRSLEV